MSGLIWSALGQAVANSGNAVGGYMLKDIEDERRLAEETRREEAAIRRMEESDRIKAERERAREEELQQRVIRDSVAARERGARIGAEREAGAFNKLAESSQRAADAGDVGSLSKEQLAEIARTNPELAREYQRMGLIDAQLPTTPDEKRLRRAEDDVRGAMDVGAHSTVVKAYQDIKKTVLDEIKEKNDREARERKDAQNDRRLDQIDARLEQGNRNLDIRQQGADAATTRANRPPSGAADPNKPATTADMQRQVVAARALLANDLGVAAKDVDAEIKTLQKRAGRGDKGAQQALEKITPSLDEYLDANRRMLQFKRAGGDGSSSAKDNGIVKSSSAGGKDYSNLWK